MNIIVYRINRKLDIVTHAACANK